MKSFNVLDRNLNCHDSYLLEASAGTGKTFSIENIVCRLLIEGDHSLLLDQILVVTFTKAATSDLKTRIRQNIEKTVKFLIENSEDDLRPDYIQAILEQDEHVIKTAIDKLKNALFTFDQAQIFTIHSFCSKMLSSHVLESDICLNTMGDEPTLLNTESLKIIRNFFRTELTIENFSPGQLSIVLKKHKSKIENVEKALLKWITGGLEVSSTTGFHELFLRFKNVMNSLSYESDKILADFHLQIPNYRKLKDHETGLEKVSSFACLFEKGDLTEDDFDLLIADGIYLLEALDPLLLKIKHKPISENELHYPKLYSDLAKTLLPIVKEASSYEIIFCRMVNLCRKLFYTYLRAEEKFRYDDLLKFMNQALKNNFFLQSVQNTYKAGIIDEFQDTDALQWNIFKSIFHENCPFYLVGDPKQSIYAFRQADIYTYLNAASLIPKNHRLSLDTNYRSEKPLIQALNAIFNSKENPEFIQLPKLQTVLEYREVKYPEQSKLVTFPDELKSLHFFIAEDDQNKSKFPLEELEEKYYFPFMAEQIIHLQNNGFKLSQIAILVKDHLQAKRVVDYFKSQDLKVSLQRLSSLAESPVLKNMIELIQAVITPRDESALKIALGSPFIGFTSKEILSLKDPLVLEDALAKFYHFRKLLFTFGFFKFFDIFLKSTWNGLVVAMRIISYDNGDDLYDDLLQIAELLIEHQSQTQCTPEGLIRFLKDFSILNFDSDDRIKKLKDPHVDAIKTLTIHSSKGLEFDIVFALGLINRTPAPETFIPVQTDGDIVLKPLTDRESDLYKRHCEELDSEKSRQLYVALTRAKYRLYIPAAFCLKNKELEQAKASCMELFLAKLKYFNTLNNPIYERIQQLTADNFIAWINNLPPNLSISYSFLNKMTFSLEKAANQSMVLLHEPEKIHVQNDSCRMISFTQLAKTASKEMLKGGVPHDFDSEDKNIFTLPSGAKTGILLHSILEALPQEKYEFIKKPEDLKLFITPFLIGTKFENWIDVFEQIIFNVLNCSFDCFLFKDINPSKMYLETEFIYPNLNGSGFMKGVIDLFFLHEDKYYFIDWKSNWLGNSADDYLPEALKVNMMEHDYYLQAEIYSEAIKRFLKIVDGRDFRESFGGIFYIFLRGLNPDKPGCGVLHLNN